MDVRKPAAGTGPFAPLKNVTFRAIWLAGLISGLGWLIQTIAMSWLMATITPSSVMVALVQAATNLPAFILSIFAGAIVDNFNRRRVMLVARSLMALTAATLTILVAVGPVSYTHLDVYKRQLRLRRDVGDLGCRLGSRDGCPD